MYTKLKKHNLAVQKIHLGRLYPEASCRIQRSELRWQSALQPTPLSELYTVSLKYKLCESPQVIVVHPTLKRRLGKLPPHIYAAGQLCLYMPGAMEWDGTMLLATMIVPWTSEWLLHYEVWLATGEWCGGGIHPVTRKHARDSTTAGRRSLDHRQCLRIDPGPMQ